MMKRLRYSIDDPTSLMYQYPQRIKILPALQYGADSNAPRHIRGNGMGTCFRRGKYLGDRCVCHVGTKEINVTVDH